MSAIFAPRGYSDTAELSALGLTLAPTRGLLNRGNPRHNKDSTSYFHSNDPSSDIQTALLVAFNLPYLWVQTDQVIPGLMRDRTKGT